jgi:hypothetical protein
MNDYTWPSVYFSYFFFTICLGVAVFFFIRSLRDGYWTKGGEDVKYHVFDDGREGQALPAPADAAPRADRQE